MADGRLTEDGASQSITDTINSLSSRASGTTKKTIQGIGSFLSTAQEQIAAFVQSDTAREMKEKFGEGLGTAKDKILELDRAGRERFAEYFPQSQASLPPKSAGKEIPTIESTPAETLKSMAQEAIPKVQRATTFLAQEAMPKLQQAGDFISQGATTLAGNLQATWKELAAQTLTTEALQPQMAKVPVSIRVNGENAFQGTLTGGQLLGLDQNQNMMIQKALTNPQTVEGSVKMLVANQPQLVVSRGQVIKDNLQLTGQLQQAQATEQKTVVSPQQQQTSPTQATVAKPVAQPTTAKQTVEIKSAAVSDDWQEALFAKVSAISTGMADIHQKISQLETKLGDHSAEFGYIADDHSTLGLKIDNLADQLNVKSASQSSQLRAAQPTVRQWVNQTRATVRTAVIAKLQEFKQFVSQKYQQLVGAKVDQATDFVKDQAQAAGAKVEAAKVSVKEGMKAAEASVKAVPYQATQAFMTKVGEPSIRFLLEKTVQPDLVGNRTLNTNNYQYSMDAKGNVAMKAKDGRGTLQPSTMNKKDLNAVGAISRHFKAHQQQQRQQQFQSTVQSKTALKR